MTAMVFRQSYVT